MAKGALIVGPSGSGKSTSGRNLDPATTFWINVANKELPFRSKGYKSVKMATPPKNISESEILTGLKSKIEKDTNMAVTSDTSLVINIMKHVSEEMPHIKRIVVDDSQYLAAFEFMKKVNVKGFEKFNTMGQNIFNLSHAKYDLRDDLIIYYMTHSDEARDAEGNLSVKAKTLGRVVDGVITLEGLYTIVLYAGVELNKDKKPEYFFYTKNNGMNTCKTPIGMFEEDKISNDLVIVEEAINDYYSQD